MAVFSSLVILSQTASIRISIACIEKKITDMIRHEYQLHDIIR